MRYLMILVLFVVGLTSFNGCVSTTANGDVIAAVNTGDSVTATTSQGNAVFLVKVDETLVSKAAVAVLLDTAAQLYNEPVTITYDSIQDGFVLTTNNTGFINAIKLIHGVVSIEQTGLHFPLKIRRAPTRR